MNGPSGVIGALGRRTGARVRALAARVGTPVVSDGPLTLAAPGEALAMARWGTVSAWLAGELHPGGPLEQVAEALAAGGERAAGAPPGAHLLVARDAESDTVWVLRDPLGARTLHHARDAGDVVFAEHVVDLLALLEATPAPDRRVVVMWIALRALAPGRTPYAGVRRLSAGETLRIAAGRATAVRTWQPRPPEETATRDAAEAPEALSAAALAAVARAAAGAARPAVLLSGGLDSACVAAGLAAAAPGRSLGLARTFPDHPAVDEASLIAQTAAATGLELVTLPYAEAELPGPMRAYAQRWGLPAPSPNLTIHPALLAAARARAVDRLLDGEGGDELFGVWPPLIADALWGGRPREAWGLVARLPRIGTAPGRRHRLALLLAYGVRDGLPPRARRILDTAGLARDALAGELVRRADLGALLHDAAADPWADLDGPHWWRAAVHGLVARGDLLDAPGTLARTAAEGPVAARHPFMHDATLLQTVLDLAPEASFGGVRDRPALRDGLRGRIPEAVRTRLAKSYFNEISARRLDGRDGELLRGELLARDAPIREFVRPAGLERAIAPVAGAGPERYRRAAWLFRLGAVNVWLETLRDGRVGGG